MTTFEIIVTVAIIAIVMLLGFIAFCVWNHYRDVELSKTLGQRLADLNIEVGTATTIDWQQVRIHVSAAMLCELSGYMFSAGYSEKQVAEQALKLTDSLIAELKKGGNNGN